MKTNLCSHKVDQIAVMQLRGYLGRGGKRKAEDSWSCSQRQYRLIASSFSKSFLLRPLRYLMKRTSVDITSSSRQSKPFAKWVPGRKFKIRTAYGEKVEFCLISLILHVFAKCLAAYLADHCLCLRITRKIAQHSVLGITGKNCPAFRPRNYWEKLPSILS